MVSVDVFEREVSRVAHAAVGLHGEIGGLANESVRAVVDHGDLIGDGHVMFLVEMPGGFVYKIADEFVFGVGFGKRELDGLLGGERLVPRDAFARVFDGFIDAVLRCADA